MLRDWPPNIALIVALTVICALAGCEPDRGEAPDDAEPWTYSSERAPYALEVPAGWKEAKADKLNRSADVALSFNDRFFAIVIPQELPNFDGVEPPDALDMQRASVELLKERIDDFEVSSEGPIEVDGESALSIIADGKDGEEAVQYVNTYATRNDWGYQIVAWGRRSERRDLEKEADRLLEGWRFTDANADSGDGEAAAPSEGRQADDAKN